MTMQLWVTDSLGGYTNLPQLSAKLRHAAQPLVRFRQFCDVKEAYGKGRDENFNFDKVGNVATAGGTLVETATIPRTNIVIYQGTGTLTEYGNALGYTQKLEQFAKFDITNPLQRALRDDMAKVTDSVAEAQFDLCKIRAVYVTDTTTVTISTDGTATATNSVNLDDYAVKEICDYLEGTMLAPKYDGEYYMSIVSTKACRGLHDHLQAIWMYTKYPTNGEVGSYYGCRFVKATNAIDNGIGGSDVSGEAYFFGAETVVEAVSLPEEIRYETKDFGRDRGIAWYGILGFKLFWNADPDNRIIKYTTYGQ